MYMLVGKVIHYILIFVTSTEEKPFSIHFSFLQLLIVDFSYQFIRLPFILFRTLLVWKKYCNCSQKKRSTERRMMQKNGFQNFCM